MTAPPRQPQQSSPAPTSEIANQWKFRPSAPRDVRRMYDVWYASVLATHNFLAESDLQEICVLVRQDYLPNHSFVVAVDDKDRAIGFMGMTNDEIDSLFIDPAHRARGLGRAFVMHALSRSAHLEVEVNAQNLQAVGFYGAMGFVTFASSPVDDCGRPYPILRMRR